MGDFRDDWGEIVGQQSRGLGKLEGLQQERAPRLEDERPVIQLDGQHVRGGRVGQGEERIANLPGTRAESDAVVG
ncbi:MAG: hypothetical protein KIT22_09125 [Verrucomicrobiae bacterium]|nr:hypothetical protein [Verrucomicrobiae bacterium]